MNNHGRYVFAWETWQCCPCCRHCGAFDSIRAVFTALYLDAEDALNHAPRSTLLPFLFEFFLSFFFFLFGFAFGYYFNFFFFSYFKAFEFPEMKTLRPFLPFHRHSGGWLHVLNFPVNLRVKLSWITSAWLMKTSTMPFHSSKECQWFLQFDFSRWKRDVRASEISTVVFLVEFPSINSLPFINQSWNDLRIVNSDLDSKRFYCQSF